MGKQEPVVQSTLSEQQAVVAITPPFESRVVAVKAKIEELTKQAEGTCIESGDQWKASSVLIAELKTAGKDIEGHRKYYTSALRAQERQVNTFFEQFSTPVNQAIRTLTAKMAAWRSQEDDRLAKERAERDRQIEANAKLLQEAEEATSIDNGDDPADWASLTGDPLPPQPPKVSATLSLSEVMPSTATPTHTEHGDVTMIDNWKWRVLDFEQVPPYLKKLVLAEDEIIALVKGGTREIPGIEIYNEPFVRHKG